MCERRCKLRINTNLGKNSMNSNRRLAICLTILFVIIASAALIASRPASVRAAQKPANAVASAPQGAVEHGRYIVEDVAMCEECHTPRDANGNLDESRKLQGAPIWIQPVRPTTGWANRAPGLSGFVGFTDAQGEDILERGIGPNGLAIQPPMHVYHMNQADAQAVMAYLRSLPAVYSR
jgi:mono/diheme cytochrome c family protein